MTAENLSSCLNSIKEVYIMKKQLMKRAWVIFRTLSGDKNAKLKAALKEAWFEMKKGTVKEEIQLDLPQLIGTEKQVDWAESLRKNYVTDMINFINSDEKFDTPKTRNTAGSLAHSMYESGITNTEPSRNSMFYKYRREAKELGLSGNDINDYESKKSGRFFDSITYKALRGKPEIDRIRDEKKVLKYVLFETLKLDIMASDWIEAFRNSRYDNEMRRIFNLK